MNRPLHCLNSIRSSLTQFYATPIPTPRQRIIAPMQNDYDFGRSLIEIPLHERYNHLKKSVEIYKQSRSRIRKIVIERLDEDLANLFGGD